MKRFAFSAALILSLLLSLTPLCMAVSASSNSGLPSVALGEISMVVDEQGDLWALGNDVKDWTFGELMPNGGVRKLMSDVLYATPSDYLSFEQFYMAIKKDGTLWAWGENTYGQLGNGSTQATDTPVQVLSNVAEVYIGASNHVLARKSDGTLWAWGQNDYGQVGNGGKSNATGNGLPIQTLPVQVAEDITSAYAGAGLYWSLAVRGDGTLLGWGYSACGELEPGRGDDKGAIFATPTQLMSGVRRVCWGRRGALPTILRKRQGGTA